MTIPEATKTHEWAIDPAHGLQFVSRGASSARLVGREDGWLLTSATERDFAVTNSLTLPTGHRFWRVAVDCAWPAVAGARCPVAIQDSRFQIIADSRRQGAFDRADSASARVLFRPGGEGTFVLPRSVRVTLTPDPHFGAALLPLINSVGAGGTQFDYVGRLRDGLYSRLLVSHPDHLGYREDIHWFNQAFQAMQLRNGGILCFGAAHLFADLLWMLGIPAYMLHLGTEPASHCATIAFCRHDQTGELIPVFHDCYLNYHLELASQDMPLWQRSDFRRILTAFEEGRGDEVVAKPGEAVYCRYLATSRSLVSPPDVRKLNHTIESFSNADVGLPYKALVKELTGHERLSYLCTIPYAAEPKFSPRSISDTVRRFLDDAEARIDRLAELQFLPSTRPAAEAGSTE